MTDQWTELLNHHRLNIQIPRILKPVDSISPKDLGKFTTPILCPFNSNFKDNWSIQLTIDQVSSILGGNRIVEVIDVLEQSEVKRSVTIDQWVKYMKRPHELRFRTLNILSLEISGTRLNEFVCAPPVVKQLDWIEEWTHKIAKCCLKNRLMYPQVQKYCIMSAMNSFTNFHVDLGGTSVWYHVVNGAKMFIAVKPSSVNMRAYSAWVKGVEKGTVDEHFLKFLEKRTSMKNVKNSTFLVHLNDGDTAFIPSGWIHAVFTPKDSLVFGGNFLHLLCCKLQISARAQEISLKIPSEKCFPYFDETMWFAAKKYVMMLRNGAHFDENELKCLICICEYLKSSINVHLDHLEFIYQDINESKIQYLARALVLELFFRIDILGKVDLVQKIGLKYPKDLNNEDFKTKTDQSYREKIPSYDEILNFDDYSQAKNSGENKEGCQFCNSDILRR